MAMRRVQVKTDENEKSIDCEVSGHDGLYQVRIGDTSCEVEVRDEAGALGLWVDGTSLDLSIDAAQLASLRAGEAPRLIFGERAVEASVDVVLGTPRASASRSKKAAARGRGAAAPGELRAMMPGLVLRVLVDEGQRVEAGEVLLVLEAMKMENELRADVDGVVIAVEVKAGDRVAKADALIRIDVFPVPASSRQNVG